MRRASGPRARPENGRVGECRLIALLSDHGRYSDDGHTPQHVCPYGTNAKDLLECRGFSVEDHWLTTREESDAFKGEHGVKSTPQTFIDGKRIGGFDDLQHHFNEAANDPNAK
jgi:glutaredoxin